MDRITRCQECGGYVYSNDAEPLDRMEAEILRAHAAAREYEAKEPFAYYSAAIPVAVVTAQNAESLLELIRELRTARTRLEALEARSPSTYPIVTLCGSTRFREHFEAEQRRLTLAGCIVISVGLFGHLEGLDFGTDDEPSETKVMLDAMHKAKIRMADSIRVIDVDGYIGISTRSEIDYAESLGKPVTYLSHDHAERVIRDE